MARQGGSRRRLRADQVHLGGGRPAAAVEIAVEGTDRYRVRSGGLAHADAGATRALQYAGAGCNHVGQSAVLREHGHHLAGAGGDGQAAVGGNGAAFPQNGRHLHHIREGGIGAAANADLIHLDVLKLLHGPDIVRAVGTGSQRNQRAEVNLQRLIILGVPVRAQGDVVLLPALGSEESTGRLVAREDRGRRPQFRAHIGDCGALRDREGFDALAGVFHNPAHPAFDR